MKRGFTPLADMTVVVPIAISLILFFAALAWATNTVESVNNRVNLSVKLVDLAEIFTAPGILTDKEFSNACTAAAGMGEGISYIVKLNCGGTVMGTCPNVPPPIPPRATRLVYAFPVPYQISSAGLPENDVCYLEVTVWKGA